LALNDGRLTLGDGQKMKLDTDPFLVNVNLINFEEKMVLVRTRQADTTRGKNVIVSDDPRARMVKPQSLEFSVWKVNHRRWTGPKVKPTSSMLLEKYVQQQWVNMFHRLGGGGGQESTVTDGMVSRRSAALVEK
jgi:hypothetical protein